MADSLLELDAISRNYASSQASSTNSFRALHSSVADISSRSRKIREATRAHLRAVKNVGKTEKELNAAIASYTIPDWLVRVGDACSRRPKGDVNCSTSELCKAMGRLVLSKAYLDSKPWNPVADSLGQTVDRYVKNIVAAAEDRVLLKFMNASTFAVASNAASLNGSSTNNKGGHARRGSSNVGHGRTMSTTSQFDETFALTRTTATSTTGGGGGGAAQLISSQVTVLFGESPPADMLEASELLAALFKNYCRVRAVMEVKSHILDKIYTVLEGKIAEYRRLRLERGASGLDGGGGGNFSSSAKSFFSSASDDSSHSGAAQTSADRLLKALKELAVNALQDSSSNQRRGSGGGLLQPGSFDSLANSNGNSHGSNNNNGSISQQLASSAAVTFGITDFPECIFGVSKAARDLSLDVSGFLEKYVLSSVPPPPRRKTATEQILDGTHRMGGPDSPIAGSPLSPSSENDNNNNNNNNNQQHRHQLATNNAGESSGIDGGGDGSAGGGGGGGGAPLDQDAADEIDELRSSVLVVPSQIVEVASSFALELLAKMVADLTVKEIHSIDTVPIILLEAVQEAWAWRHVSREICGETDELLVSIDQKVDTILQSAFDSLANLRDEPGNLTAQAFLDLALAPRNAVFSQMPFEILYITGVQALADSRPLNRDKRRVLGWRIDDSFRRASWHPERDSFFGFAPLLVDALRRMVSVHEATLHVVFCGSVDRVDGLIRRADKAIATKHAVLLREAKHKQQRHFARSNRGFGAGDMSPSSAGAAGGIDFSSLNFATMVEAESAAKSVFEPVRADIERFFEDTLSHHLNWMHAVASAAFLLAHGTFEPDERTGDRTSFCADAAGDEEQDNLLWFGVPAGKLRFHPAIFRANTLQKIIRRLSAPGVFDVGAGNQLVWSHATMTSAAPLAGTNMNSNKSRFNAYTTTTTTTSAFSPPAPKKHDLSAFSTPSEGTNYYNKGNNDNSGFDTSAFSPAHNSDTNFNPYPRQAQPQQQQQGSVAGTVREEEHEHAQQQEAPSWRAKLLESLLTICNEKLDEQVEIAGARWATILPNITQNEILSAIAETADDEPLTHAQRAEVKQWYENATAAIADELELWETGVVVIDDAGLRTTLGERAYESASKVFEEMEHGVLKGREWSTRAHRWLKFPLENLERALKTFRAPLLHNEVN